MNDSSKWDTYKKCSRCGEIFPVPDRYEAAQVLKYSVHNHNPAMFANYYNYEWRHLCPKCMDEYTTFIEGFLNG